MTETIKLPGEWGLRRLSLADETQWALQYMGMDWLYIREFLPTSGSCTVIDEEIRKFAAAMNAADGQCGRAEYERLRETALFTAGFLDGVAMRLDSWAEQSRSGGWSTHQVAENIEVANDCRRSAANLRAAL